MGPIPRRPCPPLGLDLKVFDDQKKAEDTRVVQERRAGLIDRLLKAANKHGEKAKAEQTPVKEVAPAK